MNYTGLLGSTYKLSAPSATSSARSSKVLILVVLAPGMLLAGCGKRIKVWIVFWRHTWNFTASKQFCFFVWFCRQTAASSNLEVRPKLEPQQITMHPLPITTLSTYAPLRVGLVHHLALYFFGLCFYWRVGCHPLKSVLHSIIFTSCRQAYVRSKILLTSRFASLQHMCTLLSGPFRGWLRSSLFGRRMFFRCCKWGITCRLGFGYSLRLSSSRLCRRLWDHRPAQPTRCYCLSTKPKNGHTIWMVPKSMVSKNWFAVSNADHGPIYTAPTFGIGLSREHIATLSQNVLALCSRWNAASSLGNIQYLLWVATCSARLQGPDAVRACSTKAFSSSSFLQRQEETWALICNTGRCKHRLKKSAYVFPYLLDPRTNEKKG